MAGNLTGHSRETCQQTFIRNVRGAAESAARHGITLLLEPLNRIDHPHYFYATVDQGLAMLAAIGRPDVKLQFDAYHAGMHSRDVVGALDRAWPWVGHIQIAAVPDRGEPDRGEVDMPAFLRAADERGYAGWVSCEYEPRGDTDAGLAWMRPTARSAVRCGCSSP